MKGELNRIRDSARGLAQSMGFENEFKKLNGLIGALLATRDVGALKTRAGKLVAKGTPADAARMTRFEVLAAQVTRGARSPPRGSRK